MTCYNRKERRQGQYVPEIIFYKWHRPICARNDILQMAQAHMCPKLYFTNGTGRYVPKMIFYKWHRPICAQNDSYVRNVAGSTCARNDLLQWDRSSTRPIFARNDLLQWGRTSTRPLSPWVSCYQPGAECCRSLVPCALGNWESGDLLWTSLATLMLPFHPRCSCSSSPSSSAQRLWCNRNMSVADIYPRNLLTMCCPGHAGVKGNDRADNYIGKQSNLRKWLASRNI